MRALSKRETVLLAFTTLAIGAYGGLLVGQRLDEGIGNRFKAHDVLWQAAYTVKALYGLRSGKTEGTVEWLEFRLRDDLYKLSWYAEKLPELKQDPSYLKQLKFVNEYCVKFPPQLESEIDKKIAAGAFAPLEELSGDKDKAQQSAPANGASPRR